MFVKPCFELKFVKLKNVCIANKDKGLYSLQCLFQRTTKNLHCKQQYDLPAIVNIGQWSGNSKES
jgi:hypothetical protein